MTIYRKIIFMLSLIAFNSGFAGEIPPKPEWLGNKLGIEALSGDYIDPGRGFVPMQCSGNTVITDFKRIKLNAFALPAAISVRDKKVLSGETVLRINSTTGRLKFRNAKLKLAKNGKNSIAGSSTFNNKKLAVDVKFQVDFDYTFKYEITLNPKRKQILKKVSLNFPLNLPDDKLCTFQKEAPNKREAGLEAEKRRVFMNIKDKRKLAPGFCSNFWFGNTSYGVSYAVSDARNWRGPKGQELIFDPKTQKLSINFINAITIIDKPITFSFYFAVTPIKRMPKNWRSWNFGTQYGRGPANPKFDKVIYWSFWRISNHEIFNNGWVNSPEKMRKLAAKDNAVPNRSLLHYFIPSFSTNTVVYEKDGKTYVMEDKYLRYIADKNTIIPSAPPAKINIPKDAIYFKNLEERNRVFANKCYPAKARTQLVAMNDEYIDLLAWNVNKFANDYRIGGLYSDGYTPKANYRTGFRDASGAERPHHEYDGYRRMYKRIRQIVRSNNPNELMLAHASSSRVAATLSFFDIMLFGETLFYWYQDPEKRDASSNGDFYFAHISGDIDNLKPRFFSRQWGLPQVLLPQVRGRDRKVFKNAARATRTMLTYTLQFDVLYWPLWCDAKEIEKWNRIRFNFGMKDTPMEIVDFVPYWENKQFKPSDDQVKIGYYEKIKQVDPDLPLDRGKKYLLIVSNLQFGDSKFTVSLPKKLTSAKVIEVQNNTKLNIKDHKVELNLAPYDFAILEVTGEL